MPPTVEYNQSLAKVKMLIINDTWILVELYIYKHVTTTTYGWYDLK